MKDYLVMVLISYIFNKREELKLRHDYQALVIFDHFAGQIMEALLQLLQENIYRVMVPAKLH